MIHHPLALVAVLLIIESLILYLSSRTDFKKYFQFLPPVFWIYFLPMLISTAGLIDAKSPIYQKMTTYLLPASLALLLISVDLKAILSLGKTAMIMMLSGSFGIILGTVSVFSLFKSRVGEETWSGFGALSASWTGGSANMIAVKEALNTPDSVFLPMVIVDTIVPYVWMGCLVAMVGMQPLYDRWNRSDRRVLDDLSQKVQGVSSQNWRGILKPTMIIVLGFGVLASLASNILARQLPVIKDVVSTYTWTIILVSVLGLVLSLTPVRRLESQGASRTGYFLLYFVLTSIGAKANLSDIGSTLIFIAAGFIIVLIHVLVLLLAGKIVRAPLFLTAVASQANIGGVASAPVVAEIYQPGLASVGLLLAIMGNIMGTYLGILTGQLCRMVAF